MREVWLTVEGARLYAIDDGAGPALVFLHGGLASHEAARSIVAPLADGLRVITPDLRGSGRSKSSETLTFDRLADDLVALLDHLGIEEAFVGGISSGTGPAIRFALRHPTRARALIVVRPVYAGSEVGYTPGQADAFAGMDAVARRAETEGVEVLRSMYYRHLPDAIAERAWRIASRFDAASVAATSRFIASGAQPFDSDRELASIHIPTLLVRGNDAMHPAAISDAYVAALAECTVRPAETDVASAVTDFCHALLRA